VPSHAKIPPFKSVHTRIRDTFASKSRTTRLATVTAGAALAAVAAGVSASPAMAATGSLGGTSATTLAAASKTVSTGTRPTSHAGQFTLDTTSKTSPLGQVGTSAHQPVAPIALPAPAGPLSPLARTSGAAPNQLPTPKDPVVRISLANAGNKNATTAPAANAAAQPAAPSHPQPPAPAPAPPPKPYLIYDSVTPQMIPAGQKIATYATGGYAVPASQVANRGNVLWIDTLGTDPGAQALDVEPGDATPSVAASWAWHKLSSSPGAVARIYTMISEWPAVKAAIATLPQQMQSHIRYWIADPTGVPHVVPGSDATQWYWGKSWDISTANPNF
jgi:hypothetical protein